MLPARIPKPKKRETRWRSPAHCNFVRSHSCAQCRSTSGIEVAHVRLGSGAGVGQKPDDWRTVSLCKGCHAEQHRIGETTFWGRYYSENMQSVERLIAEFIAASPKRYEIEAIQRERGNG